MNIPRFVSLKETIEMTMEHEKIIAIAGPTASGKSALALALCERIGGELISLDSMQIYRGLDIGTAKPTAEEQARVKHHLIDICDPCENYSVADFCEAAHEAISGTRARGHRAVLCGGTGLYLSSVLSRTDFGDVCSDEEYRRTLAELASERGRGCLHQMLEEIDPESAGKIHENNVRRVIRALEIYKVTGMTKTEWDKAAVEKNPPYDSVIIGLDYRDREALYARINRRVDAMIGAGLEAEVRGLVSEGKLEASTTAGQAIGYKEMVEYIEGKISLDEATEKIKLGTRRYAKRQLTWLRRMENINWIYPDDYCSAEELLCVAEDILNL